MERFAFVTLASRLGDTSAIDRVTESVRTLLDRLGGRPVPTAQAAGDLPLLILVATGGTERAVMSTVEARRAVVPFEPAVLLAHPSHNSLPAALEALASLHQRGVRGRIVYTGGPHTVAGVEEAVADLVAIHRLRSVRLGAVGAPSDWLVASSPDPALVGDTWGVEVVPIDVGDVVASHRGSSPDAEQSVAVSLRRAARRDVEPADVDTAARLYPALLEAIEESGVDAVTVRCFDFLTELETSGCLALAELNDSGIVAGCEGDVPTALAMLLARHLLDLPSWVANPSRLDVEADTLVLAHCTVAPSMVTDVELTTHFESGIGVAISGRFAPGPVTLLRVGGRGLDRFWCADADIYATGDSPDLCRTQVTVTLRDRAVTELLESPLGNHLVLVAGHHRDRLERFWRFAFGTEPEAGTPSAGRRGR